MRMHTKAAAICFALSLAVPGGAAAASQTKPGGNTSAKTTTKSGKMIIRKVPG